MEKRWRMADTIGIPCHVGPVEVIRNLFCGSSDEALDMASERIRVDTLIPLNDLDAAIWNLGFRGEILYCPIEDYRTLPDDVLNDLVSKILDRLSHGKKIGLFCMGGHGRTGYVASIVLGKLGYDDPIGFLRSNYCSKAVESNEQIRHIAEILEKPELARTYVTQNGSLYAFHFDGFDGSDFYTGDSLASPEISTCGNCARSLTGICQIYQSCVDESDVACEFFLEK